MPSSAVVSLPNEDQTQPAIARLEDDGLIVKRVQSWKTSRRWQQAMARAAVKLYHHGDRGDDLRMPIALAMVETYGGRLDDETLVGLVEAMLPIEAASLGFAPDATCTKGNPK